MGLRMVLICVFGAVVDAVNIEDVFKFTIAVTGVASIARAVDTLDRARARCARLRHLGACLTKDEVSLRWHNRISRYTQQLDDVSTHLEGGRTFWSMVTRSSVVKELDDIEREFNKVEEYVINLKHERQA